MAKAKTTKTKPRPRPLAEKKPTNDKLFIVLSPVELTVIETTQQELETVLEEQARALAMPMDSLVFSNMVQVFSGKRMPLTVERPRLKVGGQ